MKSSSIFKCHELFSFEVTPVISLVSESTVQFLMAEKLASTPVAEDEILAAMENVQPARQPLLLHRAPHPGMSTLSVEEQKIFQSLDHLNQRLQSKFDNKKDPISSD